MTTTTSFATSGEARGQSKRDAADRAVRGEPLVVRGEAHRVPVEVVQLQVTTPITHGELGVEVVVAVVLRASRAAG